MEGAHLALDPRDFGSDLRFKKVWECNRDENQDDGYDVQKFDEGEPLASSLERTEYTPTNNHTAMQCTLTVFPFSGKARAFNIFSAKNNEPNAVRMLDDVEYQVGARLRGL